jgi:phenylalanine-4-hydroxylase
MVSHAALSARTLEECLIGQNWERYTPDEHQVWRTLFERQQKTLAGHVAPEYQAGLAALRIGPEGIPDFRRMNERLEALTGWEVVAVPGLIASEPFFKMLSSQRFPAGTFIRTPEQLDYLEEPDIFHDVFGHVPLLTDPAYADYMQEYGRIGLEACKVKGVKFLARLNWYTIEFGLIRKPDGVKIYGAGIVSSFGEARYVIEDPSAHHIGFDLERVLRTGYYIDDFQASYFVIDRFEDLFALLRQTDFRETYERLRPLESFTPFETRSEDAILRSGTGDYWRKLAETKTRLK